jgi:hypothetical protein
MVRTVVHVVQVVTVVSAMLVWLALIPIVDFLAPRAEHSTPLEETLFQAA